MLKMRTCNFTAKTRIDLSNRPQKMTGLEMRLEKSVHRELVSIVIGKVETSAQGYINVHEEHVICNLTVPCKSATCLFDIQIVQSTL